VSQQADREKRKDAIKESSGPSLRELELQQINSALVKENMVVKEILSDGNCLYRCTYFAWL